MAVYFLLEFIGFTEHLCLITASTAVYALINQGSFAEMILTVMNLSVGISTSQTQIMKQNCPIWPLSKSQITVGSCFLKHDKGYCVQQEWAIAGCAVSDSVEWSHLWAFIIIITFFSRAAKPQPALLPSLCALASKAALTGSWSLFIELLVGYCTGIDFISSISQWRGVIKVSHSNNFFFLNFWKCTALKEQKLVKYALC